MISYSKAILGAAILLIAMVAVACGDDDVPTPLPTATPIDLSPIIDQIAALGTAPTTAEIQALVETAVAAGVPAGVTATEIKSLVDRAVAAIPSGLSAAEIQGLVETAVAAASTPGLTGQDVQKIVSDALMALPTATPIPTATPPPIELKDATLKIAHDASVQNVDIEFAAGGGDGAQESARNLNFWPLQHAVVPLGDGNSRMNVNEFEPLLAESWSFSADGSTITINWRPGVLSERGNELVADDFKFFVDRSFHTQRVWAFIWRSLGVTDPDQVVVTGKYSMDFNLPTFNSVFIHTFTIFFTVQDSVTMLENATADDPFALDWNEKNSVGYGPYKLAELRVGEQTVFEANPFFYRGRPQVVRAIQLTVPEPSVRASLLEAGSVDIAWRLDVDDLARIEGQPGVKVLRDPDGEFGQENVLQLNNGRPPFDDIRVRKAIAHAIPYDEIINGVFRGKAIKQNFLLRPVDFGAFPADREFYGPDTAMATALLAEAGYGPDNPLSFTSIISDQSPGTGLGSLVAIQTALRDIGVNMDIDIITQANLGGQRFTRPLPYDALWDDSNRALVPHGLYTYTHFFQPTGISCCNFADYNNQDIVTMLQAAVQAQDPAEQVELIQEMQSVIMNDLPYVPIAYNTHAVAMRDNISGFIWTPAINLQYAFLRKE